MAKFLSKSDSLSVPKFDLAEIKIRKETVLNI